MATLEQLRLNLRRGGVPRPPLPPTPLPAQGTLNLGPPRPMPAPTVAPQPTAGMTPQGKQALDFLNRYKAAQASALPAQGSPGFTGPPRPAVPITPATPAAPVIPATPATPAAQSMLGRTGNVLRATGNAIRGTAGVVGRGVALATSPAATGALLAVTPRTVGAGTLDSPEAQRALAENEKVRLARGDNLVGELGNYPGLKSSSISGFVNNPPGSTEGYSRTYIPSEAEDAARRSRMPINTIARPEGVANIQRGTGVVEAPIANPQQAERTRIARIKGRISPENPYGADIVGGNMRTGQVQGISTQEQADRNLQSRFQQDAAASQMAASFDRSTEALRDLRAERMGIPRSQLDVAEGRVKSQEPVTPQQGGGFGDNVLARDRFLRQFQPKEGSLGGAKRRAQANTIAAQQAWDQNQQAMQRPVVQAPVVNPLDAQRFLLDQQKFGWQQGVDKGRLTLDQAKMQNEAATTSLAQKKQDIEAKNAFTEKFSIGDENAPNDELAAGAWEISKATGGVVSPEIVAGYMQRSGIDWKNGPPKNMNEYFKSIAAQITKDYQGQ